MSHEAFLRTIIAQPDDDLPRLVYADWLDERDDPARAEFIRIQCELAHLPDDDAERRPMLEDREHELLAEHEPAWLGSELVGLQEWEFQRGFLHSMTAELKYIQEWPDSFHELSTVRDCTPTQNGTYVNRREDQELHSDIEYHSSRLYSRLVTLDLSQLKRAVGMVRELLIADEFPSLKKLNLTSNSEIHCTAESLQYWPILPHLDSLFLGEYDPYRSDYDSFPTLHAALSRCKLTELSLYHCGLTTGEIGALLETNLALSLKSLDISANLVYPDVLRAFQQANPAMRLNRLDVSGLPSTKEALESFWACHCLENLTEFEINNCLSTRKVMESVANSRYWSQASKFRAYNSQLSATQLEPLCQATGPSNLKLLDLGYADLRPDGVQMLCNAPWADSITWLGLTGTSLDDESVKVLAESGRFQKLRTLHLGNNDVYLDGNSLLGITNESVVSLANANNFANLRILTLNGTEIEHVAVEAVMNSPHWKLSGLNLGDCKMQPQLINPLAASPRLARLSILNLSNNPSLAGDALLPLAESPYLSRLCELDIRGCGASDRVREILRERLGPRLSD